MSCINSIRKFTEKGLYEIIVVDNNSTDGTVKWLKEQDDLKLVLNDYNAGFPKGCNQGIAAAEKDSDILLLNNDTIVTPNWLENLKECLYSEEKVGAVGPVTNSCSYLQAIKTNFTGLKDMFAFAEKMNTSGKKDYEQKVRLIGFCMLIKRAVIDKIGLLDERFSPGNFEDDDYSYRIEEAGYKLLVCRNAFIYHYGSKSFNANAQKFQTHLNENAKIFEEKWGFNSNYSSFIRDDIVGLIDDKKSRAIKVLEIGCACGASLLRIKNKYKRAKLYGIELNKNSAKIASGFADVRSENIENAELSYKAGFFDYIIFADVLEHLYDPGKVLCKMKKYLKEGGCILASIPNVMHYSVMAGLLSGSFTYADAGILDKTHLRFFTLHEVDKMFAQSGYSDMIYKSNIIALNENDKLFVDTLVKIAGEDKRLQFCAYQYIVKAKKRND
jgi:O-antigen biosynthesis protein